MTKKNLIYIVKEDNYEMKYSFARTGTSFHFWLAKFEHDYYSSHTNTCNGTPTRATPGRQRALQKPMAAGRSSERTESERVTTGFRRGAEREYIERSKIHHKLEATQGINFVHVQWTYTVHILHFDSFYPRICLLHIKLKGYL